MVPARQGHSSRTWLPKEHLCARAIGHQEEIVASQLVLLGAADAERAVKSGRAKEVAGGRIGRIRIRPRVDDYRPTERGELEGELVVVAVSAHAVATGAAAVD